MALLARPLLVVLGTLILLPGASGAGVEAKSPIESDVERLQGYSARQQVGVRLLDGISRALPELLWLNHLTVASEKIVIEGQAFNTNAIANFIENLDKLPEFSEPTLRSTIQMGNGTYGFVLSLEAVPPARKGTSPAEAKGTYLSGPARLNDTAKVMRELRSVIEQSEIQLARFTPGALAERSVEQVWPFRITAHTSSYQALAILFDRLARFSPVVALQQLDVARDAEANLLVADFTLEIPILKKALKVPEATATGEADESEEAPPARPARQPFLALKPDAAARSRQPEGVSGLRIVDLEVRGIIRTSQGYVVQVWDRKQNRSYLLKEGDRLFDGELLRISRDEAVFRQTSGEAGGGREVVLRLPEG